MYFLNINKPKGITSFDVIRILRKKLKIKQIGHSGTLDPLASGVMQIGVGKCTKLLDYLSSDKQYIAQIHFGYITDTFDDEGEKEFIKKPNFSEQELLSALSNFLGKTKQVPPKYSAIKINGKKACDLVRKDNIDFNINAREIEIYNIELLEFDNEYAKIKVDCKKGTYIRSLVSDLGKQLGCGAYLKDLIRTKAGNFELVNSDELDCDNFRQISPIDTIELDKIELNDSEYNRIINGNFIDTDACENKTVILIKNKKLVSIANMSDNLIKPKRIFKEC